MATSSSSSSTFPKKINRYKLPTTLSLLLLFLFYLFFFTRTPLDPKLELYTDPTPAPILLSPPRSTGVHGKLGDITKPVSSLSDADDNVDENVAVNSELPEHKFNEEEPISLKSDNDDSTSQEREEAFVSADSESQGKLGERNGELISSNEEKVFSELPEHKFKEEPISSKSDVDDGTSQERKEAFVSADFESQDKLGERNGELISSNEEKVSSELPEPEFREESEKKGTLSSSESESESQDDFGERNGEDISSNEENAVVVSSESLGDKTRGESEDIVAMEKPEDDVGETTDDSISSNKELTVASSSESDENGVEETASSDTNNGGVIDNAFVDNLRKCDIYKGTWVKDEGYPIYKPGSCPYVDDGYDCHGNGRPDSGYTQWRWKPDECDLPRFNATDFLVRLRGKRLMLVGDSMNRNQFESLLCLLREGLADKSRMYETHGYKITKGRGYYIFRFKDYDCTVEFVRSHFLVREGVRINARGNSNPTLSIDRIDKTAARWLRADILVFNTGHWWTHGKTARGKNYYKEGNHIYPHFDAAEAYRRAITTWATWVKKNIRRKTLVFYRGYSSAHFRGGDWDSGGSCNGETKPVVRGAILDSYPQKMTIVEQVLKETQVPVVLLNVTRLTNYRKDGHPSVYGKNVTRLKKVSTRRQDCSHWCLPGVPDAWNELIYTTLVVRQTSSH